MRKAGLLSLLLVGGIAQAEDAPCPTARDEVDFVYERPAVVVSPQSLTSLLAPGAVIATEIADLAPSIEESDGPIDVEGPIAVHLPGGQKFGRRLVDGTVMPCVYWGLAAFEPPRDDEGRMFPTICLVGGEGEPQILRFFAYKAASGKGVFDAPIAKVSLTPIVDASAPAERLRVYRRLRVLSVDGESARLVNEYAALPIGAAGDPKFSPADGEAEIALPLREGPAHAAGLTLNLISIGDAWSVTPQGAFESWVRFECNGARIKLGKAPVPLRTETADQGLAAASN